jgi:hypothetical protein
MRASSSSRASACFAKLSYIFISCSSTGMRMPLAGPISRSESHALSSSYCFCLANPFINVITAAAPESGKINHSCLGLRRVSGNHSNLYLIALTDDRGLNCIFH